VWNAWLAAVPPCAGLAGWLFGGMDSKLLLCFFYLFAFKVHSDLLDFFSFNRCVQKISVFKSANPPF
jgi:hypothetical protein